MAVLCTTQVFLVKAVPNSVFDVITFSAGEIAAVG
jgi:hypothetical protein